MPNWCNNYVEIRHPDAGQVTRAFEALQRGEFLQEFLPCPQELRDTVSGFPGDDKAQAHAAQVARNIEKYGAADWYQWQTSHWGTKWDVGGTDANVELQDANTVTASFDSAWAPPTQAYQHLEQLGFEIDAWYHEPGMAFCGRYTNGEDDYREYSDADKDTVREMVGEELDDFWCISECMAEWEEDDLETDLDDGPRSTNE